MNQSNPLSPPVFPYSWASAWGEDQYGLWQAFSYQTLCYVFRWIPPGNFMMGSPEEERERYRDEDLHHVTLSQGFWLAESTVSQALWQTLIPENPSHFVGENLPVEKVSWDDIQGFIKQFNQLHPELRVRLPWEAEWEYACRAGTSTPFSFGANISPEQVNYDGENPYVGGKKGLYREKTVPVKSLPASPWGLYEMHGNVWEWCEDVWQEALGKEAVSDPWQQQALPASVSARVVRGGSWNSLGWSTRSAIRSGGSPDDRYSNLGFRLALGHSGSVQAGQVIG